MSTFCQSTLPITTSNVDKSRNVRLPFLSLKNSMNAGFLDSNLTRTLPQWLLWGSYKNLHDISTPVISGTSLSYLILHLSIYFKLVSDSCFCYPCWRCTKFNPPNVVEHQQHSPFSNNTSVTTYVHRMIISPSCLFKNRKDGERVAMILQCLLDHKQQ